MGANSTSFKPGRKKTGGRKAGVPSKTSADFKMMLMAAAEEIGSDGVGAGGAVGYLAKIAIEDPACFCRLLSRILKSEMDYEQKRRPLSSFSDEELFAEMRGRSLPAEEFFASP